MYLGWPPSPDAVWFRRVCGNADMAGLGGRPVKLRKLRTAQPAANPMESLILAQDKRWRRALRMQVERSPRLRVGRLSGKRLSNA